MRRLFLIALIPVAAHADWYGPEYRQCQGTTAALVACLDRLTRQWDGRLNKAYQERLRERPDELRAAQRLWIEYRNANCRHYREGPGSIAAIEGAECMRVMTRQRALELEQR
jgi:uncharacterized protein YecT (DUF1311 family)